MVCDHNTLTGSQHFAAVLKDINMDIPVILSEEITTCEGEIIGIFLNEEIPSQLTADETLDLITDQGGLAIVPHPFDRYRKKALVSAVLDNLIGKISLIEGYNGRTLNKDDNMKAVRYAQKHNCCITAGSDAHIPFELGKTYVEIAHFEGPEEFKQQLKTAKIHYKRANFGVHAITKIVKGIRD